MLEDLDITVADQIKRAKKNNFALAWDSPSADGQGEFFFDLF